MNYEYSQISRVHGIISQVSWSYCHIYDNIFLRWCHVANNDIISVNPTDGVLRWSNCGVQKLDVDSDRRKRDENSCNDTAYVHVPLAHPINREIWILVYIHHKSYAITWGNMSVRNKINLLLQNFTLACQPTVIVAQKCHKKQKSTVCLIFLTENISNSVQNHLLV